MKKILPQSAVQIIRGTHRGVKGYVRSVCSNGSIQVKEINPPFRCYTVKENELDVLNHNYFLYGLAIKKRLD